MKVLLLANIKGIGQMGDIKDVSDGYARNYLLPRKSARLADAFAQKEAEDLKKKRQIVLEQEQKLASEAKEKLTGLVIELAEKANDTGTLFAQVGKKEIVAEVKKNAGVILSDEMIILHEHIKSVGEHTVTLDLAPGIQCDIKLDIKALDK